MARELHVSSLLVHGAAGRLNEICAAIEGMAGAEVHARDPAGKLIVTIESGNEAEIGRQVEAMRALDGVHAANLVYHQVDDAVDAEERL